MASNVNPNNIDQDYPVAGQDNDSQGFRDNFTNIKTNFANTELELEDLQNNVLLKNALTGGTLDNDLDGASLVSALMQDMRSVVSTNANAAIDTAIDVKAATYYKLTSSASITFNFSNWPAAGQHSKVYIEITITDAAFTVTLPSGADESAKGLQNYGTDNQIHYDSTGVYLYELSTTDAGSTITINEISRSRNDFWRDTAPATTNGAMGDRQGMIAFDADYAYFCRGDYTDGVGAIWTRVAIATW